jgi:hypothetical protein
MHQSNRAPDWCTGARDLIIHDPGLRDLLEHLPLTAVWRPAGEDMLAAYSFAVVDQAMRAHALVPGERRRPWPRIRTRPSTPLNGRPQLDQHSGEDIGGLADFPARRQSEISSPRRTPPCHAVQLGLAPWLRYQRLHLPIQPRHPATPMKGKPGGRMIPDMIISTGPAALTLPPATASNGPGAKDVTRGLDTWLERLSLAKRAVSGFRVGAPRSGS